jgi:hypothetical protein
MDPLEMADDESEGQSDDDEISGFLSRISKRPLKGGIKSSTSDPSPKCRPSNSSMQRAETKKSAENGHDAKRQRIVQCDVDWPIPFRGKKISFAGESRSRAAFQAMDWYYHVLDRYLEAGYASDSLVSMFRAIPDELACVLKESLASFQVLRASTMASLRCPPANSTFREEEINHDDGFQGCCEWETAVWDEQEEVGMLKFEWDAATQVFYFLLPARAY